MLLSKFCKPSFIDDNCDIKVRGPVVQTLCIEKDSYMDAI